MMDDVKERKKLTNADKIRRMPDEELAKLMGENSTCAPECATTEKYCDTHYGYGSYNCYYGCWLNWLKQEVE